MRTFLVLVGLLVSHGLWASPVAAQPASDSTYTVQSGDTLYGIAERVGVSVRTLMRWNDLDDTTLAVGQTLWIRPPARRPQSSETDDAAPSPPPDDENERAPDSRADTTESSADDRASYGRYRSQAGDTFVALALRIGTTADSLFSLNDSTTAPLPPGRQLRLPAQFGPSTHIVEKGETLYSIAGEYGVSVRALKVQNDLETNTLSPGQQLRVPRPGRTSRTSPDSWASPDTSGRVAVYPEAFAGRLTASGTAYDPDDYVVSHPTLPFNSVILLSTPETKRATFARIVDRGPVDEGVLLDVSRAVAKQLDIDNGDDSTVDVRVVWDARERQ